jgi:hypothetical protein
MKVSIMAASRAGPKPPPATHWPDNNTTRFRAFPEARISALPRWLAAAQKKTAAGAAVFPP